MRLFVLLLIIPAICFASHWECINRNGLVSTCNTWRWHVPHGWLVSVDNYDYVASVAFYPDETHEWKSE